jgi:uncharacterized protein YjiS (DUF1127 family)
MYTYAQPRTFSAMVLLYLSVAFRSAAYRLRGAARRLDEWIARRRAALPAIRDLQAMSYRELRDIGLTGFDVQHLAWGGNAPGRPWQNARENETTIASKPGSAGFTRDCDGLAHLDARVLKDIGAPHWLVARAAEPQRRDAGGVQWDAFDG